jgi:hypothetical protein
MGGVVTIWALCPPEGVARDAQGFVGIGGPCTSQKATTPEFPVASVAAFLQHAHVNSNVCNLTSSVKEHEAMALACSSDSK